VALEITIERAALRAAARVRFFGIDGRVDGRQDDQPRRGFGQGTILLRRQVFCIGSLDVLERTAERAGIDGPPPAKIIPGPAPGGKVFVLDIGICDLKIHFFRLRFSVYRVFIIFNFRR
jgi:hypothetical protein